MDNTERADLIERLWENGLDECEEAIEYISALAAKLAEVEAERDDQAERIDELQHACEVVSSEFEGELWQSCRPSRIGGRHMIRKENLIALRDGLIADQCSEELILALWPNDAPDRLLAYVVDEAAQGDMNAALAFVADVLPEWDWIIGSDGCVALFYGEDGPRSDWQDKSPARALLIAALNALIEETDT